jgi:hypothetical protein
MWIIVEISLDSEKVKELRKKAKTAREILDSSCSWPLKTKRQAVKGLLDMMQKLIDEMVTTRIVTKCREVANG